MWDSLISDSSRQTTIDRVKRIYLSTHGSTSRWNSCV